jgi:microcystin-dependent protein
VASRLNVSGVTTLNSSTTCLSTFNVTGTTTINDTLMAYQVHQAYATSPLSFALLVPTGCIMQFAGSSIPNGWLACNGSAVNRSTYITLFGVIGTTYGVGDGSTTFNLPDLKGRVPLGVGQGSGLTDRVLAVTGGTETHTLTTAEMPIHNHTASDSGHTHSGTTNTDGSHTHTITDPGHSHNIGTETVESGAGSVVANNDQGNTQSPYPTTTSSTGITINNSDTHTHAFTTNTGTASITIGNTGSGNAHNNMQPFIVLNFIIKY